MLAPRDPATLFSVFFLFLAIQGILWAAGRHSLELDWWRALPFVVLLHFASAMLVHTGFTPEAMVAGYAAPVLAVWILSGFLYGPELRQRIGLAVVLPLLGFAAYPLGLLLRREVFGY